MPKTIYDVLGREPVHPFPARMAPGIALQAMSDMSSARVLDPMMGSGTVLAMSRSLGHRGIGFDLDPLAVLISTVWTTTVDVQDVREEANSMLERSLAEFKHTSCGDAYPADADLETRQFL